MDNRQTENFTNNITRLFKKILKIGKEKEKHKRFKVGCEPSKCSKIDAIFLKGIVCEDLCYYNEEYDNTINDYLVKNK